MSRSRSIADFFKPPAYSVARREEEQKKKNNKDELQRDADKNVNATANANVSANANAPKPKPKTDIPAENTTNTAPPPERRAPPEPSPLTKSSSSSSSSSFLSGGKEKEKGKEQKDKTSESSKKEVSEEKGIGQGNTKMEIEPEPKPEPEPKADLVSKSGISDSAGKLPSSSQRTTKNGKQIVLDSDSEDLESHASDEDDPDGILEFFMRGNSDKEEGECEGEGQDASKNEDGGGNGHGNGNGLGLGNEGGTRRSQRLSSKAYENKSIESILDEPEPVQKPSREPAPKYKFSLDSLVTNAVDDRELEDNVTKLKANIEAADAFDAAFHDNVAMMGGDDERKNLQQNLLTSAFEENNNSDLQRLYDAVQRTEAFDQGKLWSFFDNAVDPIPPPEFPHSAAMIPGSYAFQLKG